MPPTARGIYHNLLESKYIASNGELSLFFSSELYRDKFINEFQKNRLNMNKTSNKLWQKHNINVGFDFTALHDIILYRMIEKRGFRINFLGVDITWQETLAYVSRKMIEPNTSDYVIMSHRKFVESIKNSV